MNDFNNLLDKDAEYVLNLPYHLAEGDMTDDLCKLLTEFEFLSHKVSTLNPQSLIEDYELAVNFDMPLSEETKLCFQLIQEAIRLAAYILSEDATQLAGQLLGRLLQLTESTKIKQLLESAQQYQNTPWLRPIISNLIQPKRALQRILTGHNGSIYAVAITPDGKQVVSASLDKTLKIWDLATAKKIITLYGDSRFNCSAVAPDRVTIVAGDCLGMMHFLRLEGMEKIKE